MWQRIQTLYLAIVVILSIVQIFIPVAGITDLDTTVVYAYKGCHLVDAVTGSVALNAYFLPLLPIIIAIIAFVTILIYRKRILQMRLCVINMILAIGYYGYLYYHLFVARENFTNAAIYWSMPSSFQLINFILLILAFRNIAKDEALVRAADRMR